MSDSTTPLGRLSRADLQNVKFPRRELPGKLLAIASPFLLLKPLTPKAQSPSEVQPKPLITKDYPLPEFSIGDLVASDWENYDEDDENEETPILVTDFGEILGMRWVPEPDSFGLTTNGWVYFVRWTRTTSDCVASCYPCYDGEPTEASALRLVNHA
jgi:hypothetical protein